MDKLINYLDAINDYNSIFCINLSRMFFITEISKDTVFSYDELLNKIFNIADINHEHNAELIKLKGFEFPVKNFIKDNMLLGTLSFILDNMGNYSSSKRANLMKTLGVKSDITAISINKRIEELDKNNNYSNAVADTFFNLLVDYSGIPIQTFFIKSNPNFYYALFGEDILLEYEDKYICLSYFIDD